MTERLLQYIWQHQYFNRVALFTTEGEALAVVNPGTLNTNQGPDFLNARARIGSTLWTGNVELHVYATEWNEHQHTGDANYSNVILHVVWECDGTIASALPTLELKGHIPRMLLERYDELMNATHFIPCENKIQDIDDPGFISWKRSLLIERLEQKSQYLFELLKLNENNWEELCWWKLARNFGATVNSEGFENIARSLPFTILLKHRAELLHLEALLFGQAGLLDRVFKDHYPHLLQKEFRFYKKKYKLKTVHSPLFFLRMRPSNFPTVRLAQLAKLLQTENIFAKLRDAQSISAVKNILKIGSSEYWDDHYVFDEPAPNSKKQLGSQMTQNILINSMAVLVFAFGHFHKLPQYQQKALDWLNALPAEENKIIQGFERLGIKAASATDSQALIQLKSAYCDHKKCLDCSLGIQLLKS